MAHQALDLALGVDFVVKGARSFTAGMIDDGHHQGKHKNPSHSLSARFVVNGSHVEASDVSDQTIELWVG